MGMTPHFGEVIIKVFKSGNYEIFSIDIIVPGIETGVASCATTWDTLTWKKAEIMFDDIWTLIKSSQFRLKKQEVSNVV